MRYSPMAGTYFRVHATNRRTAGAAVRTERSAIPSWRLACGDNGSTRTVCRAPVTTKRESMDTPSPCSTMERTTLSYTWLPSTSGRISPRARRISLSNPLVGMRKRRP